MNILEKILYGYKGKYKCPNCQKEMIYIRKDKEYLCLNCFEITK